MEEKKKNAYTRKLMRQFGAGGWRMQIDCIRDVPPSLSVRRSPPPVRPPPSIPDARISRVRIRRRRARVLGRFLPFLFFLFFFFIRLFFSPLPFPSVPRAVLRSEKPCRGARESIVSALIGLVSGRRPTTKDRTIRPGRADWLRRHGRKYIFFSSTRRSRRMGAKSATIGQTDNFSLRPTINRRIRSDV